MTPRVLRAIGLGVACALLLAAGASGNPPPGSSASKARAIRSGATGAIGARATSILGSAWNADNSPIPNARLRLRNALTGRIEATAEANDAGRFAFTGVESGTYVIELVSESGKVVALGQTFTVAPGETIATFVRLATRVPWFNGFFSNVAAAASSTAASAGVTAIAPGAMRAVSPQR